MTILAHLPAPNVDLDIAPSWDVPLAQVDEPSFDGQHVHEGHMSSLGRPPWNHMGYHQVAGTGRRIPIVAGLYWDQGSGLGTYYSADGKSYLCNDVAARSMAEADGVDLDHQYAGEHTGGVVCVNYRFDPCAESRLR